MSEQLLKEHILELSQALDFEEAKAEWVWVGVTYAPDWDHCPCSQAIKEVCHIKNKITGAETHVGNNCINKFLDIETGNIFSMLRKLMEDPKGYVIPDTLTRYAEKFGYIYKSEVEFLLSLATRRRRNMPLSEKQQSWKDKIVRRILNKIQV